jgi:uncharacterized protein with HEPN domain
MSERQPQVLIGDMREAVERIRAYTEGMDFEQFLRDRKTGDAVLRNLQVLGEAASRVPHHVREAAPEIEWQRIIRSRHIVVHAYFGVDLEIVWRIVQVHLPPPEVALNGLQDRLAAPGAG